VTPYVPAVVDFKGRRRHTIVSRVWSSDVCSADLKPVAGLVTGVRVTVPAKLNVLVSETEIAEPVAPELKFTGVPTEIVKSPTWKIGRASCREREENPEVDGGRQRDSVRGDGKEQ